MLIRDWSSDVCSYDLAFDTVIARLGYPPDDQHYFSGFVLNGEDRALWRLMDSAADAGRRRGAAETFVWAYPQVVRDGFIHFDETEAEVQPFHDVAFPRSEERHVGKEWISTCRAGWSPNH